MYMYECVYLIYDYTLNRIRVQNFKAKVTMWQ